MKLNIIDLFCGCGGLTDGFLQTNKFKTLAAVDWELAPVKTLQKRLETKWNYLPNQNNIFHFDIQRSEELLNGFDDDEFNKGSGLLEIIGNQKVDLIIGGPPCQAYSMAGRVQDQYGMQNDYRNYLFESYIKVVDQFKPKAFVFENVEGILSAKPGGIPIIERVREAFLEIGYEITGDLRKNALLDASFFGIPQKRKRVIIFGVKVDTDSKDRIDEFYSLINKEKQFEATPSAIVFDDLPRILPLKTTDKSKTSHYIETNNSLELHNHHPRYHNARDVDIFRTLALDIQSGQNKYVSTKALIKFYTEKTGRVSRFHKYHVIRSNKPSNTIPAHLSKDGLRHIHPDPEQARTITVREAAKIQSFDDDFEFLGGMGDQYRMVGNAVPPKLAKIIAECVIKVIDQNKKSSLFTSNNNYKT